MRENCSHKGNFQAMKMGLVPKCSEEHSPVRGQWLGVRGQGSGVRGQNRGQISRFEFFRAFFRLHESQGTHIPGQRPPWLLVGGAHKDF